MSITCDLHVGTAMRRGQCIELAQVTLALQRHRNATLLTQLWQAMTPYPAVASAFAPWII